MMLNIKKIFIILLALSFLCGCKAAENSNPVKKESSPQNSITVNDKTFSVEEINEGIKSTFNSVLYYHGDNDTSPYLTANKNLLLNKEIEYELYFEPNSKKGEDAFVFAPKIYFAITNVEHPLSTKENPQLYEFGIDITEKGLRSDFSYQSRISKGETYSFIKDETVYLGSHSFLIKEIEKPLYEQMNKEWVENAESAIRLYMDKNDFYGDSQDNLAAGKYSVYVQSFFESDKDSTIVFENENGSIYVGEYYFVHNVSGGSPANLNRVELIESADKNEFKTYLEKLRLDSAVSMEYTVR